MGPESSKYLESYLDSLRCGARHGVGVAFLRNFGFFDCAPSLLSAIATDLLRFLRQSMKALTYQVGRLIPRSAASVARVEMRSRSEEAGAFRSIRGGIDESPVRIYAFLSASLLQLWIPTPNKATT